MSRVFEPLGLTSAPGYAYDVRIVGVGGKLEDRLEEASVLFAQKKKPPSNLQGLRRRVQSDRDLFLRVLRSRGWYDGTVTWDIDTAKKPALVTMTVTRGVRTMLARIRLEGLPPEAGSLAGADELAALGLVEGAPALAESVLVAENGILATLAARGYPFAVLTSREARIDRRAHTLAVTLRVDVGPQTRFGEVHFEGLDHVDERFARNRVSFERGELFSPKEVEDTRKALFASGVFSGVSIGPGKREDVAADGQAPIRVLVTEGKFHSVGVGLKYSSADGPGGRVFWENRNLFGGAEKFRFDVEVAENIATGGVSYRKPDWYSVGQSLLLDVKAESDKPPAYDRYAIGGSAGVERPFTKHLVGTAGLALEQSYVNSAADRGGTERFTLVGIPVGLRYDASDDLLDPSRGHRTLAGITPYFSVVGGSVQMAILHATESFYVPLDDKRRQVWATRLSLGSVVGPERNEIPADKRLYAGGGDSVRGYEYQFVGPIRNTNAPQPDRNCESEPPNGNSVCKPDFRPEGGRSLLQVGTEMRWKVTDRFGLVPFIEGAGVYESSYPDFQEDFLWSAGLGMRYFTIAGPIRFDVGFPLNPRQSDDIFQVYISLGQAF